MTVRVLIVEDTDHVREMLRHVMELQGFEVAGEASSATEALALARETSPDVVVMDYKMPDVDGLEATRWIRAERPDQSVILYTAFPDHDLVQRAHDAGVVTVVPKTSGVEALAREIAAVTLSLDRDGTDPG